MPLIPALRRQRQVDLCEFKASLVYKGEFQDKQGYNEKFCLVKTIKERERGRESLDLKCTLKACVFKEVAEHTWRK